MRYLREALRSYEADYGHFPATLDALQPRYLDTPERLQCPREAHGHGTPYHYHPASTDTPNAIVIRCDNHGQGGLALLRDGRISFDVVLKNPRAPNPLTPPPGQ